MIEDLIPQVDLLDTAEWLERCNKWRKQYPLKYPKQGGLRAQHVLDRLNSITGGDAVISVDVGQHQMWAAQFCRTRSNRHWLTSGGAGTMGYGFPGRHRCPVRLARTRRSGPWSGMGAFR